MRVPSKVFDSNVRCIILVVWMADDVGDGRMETNESTRLCSMGTCFYFFILRQIITMRCWNGILRTACLRRLCWRMSLPNVRMLVRIR